jgi:hypothetical protein
MDELELKPGVSLANGAPPETEYVVIIRIAGEANPLMGHVPLVFDRAQLAKLREDADTLGRAAAVEVIVDSLSVRNHRNIESVRVIEVAQMSETAW